MKKIRIMYKGETIEKLGIYAYLLLIKNVI